MRARRFESEQAAFEREQEDDMQAALASTSLAGRLGAAHLTSPAGALGTLPPPDPNVIDWDEYTVVGTSTKLEKPYLRLTSAPDPKTVRPLATLRQTLELLKQKWREENNYAYICDQFKSMRQDLTVQRIKNDFTVQVYEIHARIALEKGDLGEYNQCQSQLRGLYAYGLPGHTHEFLAYRILYLLHTRNQRDVNALMAELTTEDKLQPAVAHALAVRAAMRAGASPPPSSCSSRTSSRAISADSWSVIPSSSSSSSHCRSSSSRVTRCSGAGTLGGCAPYCRSARL